jgi:DNA uptake protein ComE-like DNA-binding protein
MYTGAKKTQNAGAMALPSAESTHRRVPSRQNNPQAETHKNNFQKKLFSDPQPPNHHQPPKPNPHLNAMNRALLRSIFLTTAALLIVSAFVACNNSTDNPDEIRRRTAQATETVRQDTKAVVEGVKEGMSKDNKGVNINKASREDLLTLPGVTDHEADRIIANRPYDDAHDLVKRHIVTPTEYDKIQDRITAAP